MESKVINTVINDIILALKTIKRVRKEVEKEEKDLMQLLYNEMGENEQLITPDGVVVFTWKYTKDASYFDTRRFKEENPRLAELYIEQRPGSRRLDFKDNKGKNK